MVRVEKGGVGMEVKNDKINPNEFEEAFKDNVVVTTLEKALDFCRSRSLHPFMFGPACCAMELMQAMNGRYDLARYGFEAVRATPRQTDVMLVAGTITNKMAAAAKRLYDQIPDPKWVIAIGSCAISGGPFADSYGITRGADQLFPVDVHVPGCPPRPEAITKGLLELRDMINNPKLAKVKKHE